MRCCSFWEGSAIVPRYCPGVPRRQCERSSFLNLFEQVSDFRGEGGEIGQAGNTFHAPFIEDVRPVDQGYTDDPHGLSFGQKRSAQEGGDFIVRSSYLKNREKLSGPASNKGLPCRRALLAISSPLRVPLAGTADQRAWVNFIFSPSVFGSREKRVERCALRQ